MLTLCQATDSSEVITELRSVIALVSGTSLLRRGLFRAALSVKVVLGLGRGKNGSARGMPGRGKREERPLPYFVRLAGQICGSVVMAGPKDELDDFDCAFKDLSLRGK